MFQYLVLNALQVELKPSDVIQCRECGYCILYKKRTRRIYVMCCSWTPNFSMRENVHFVWM
ncbi:hypothetical protein HN51_069422, partial [Arachis hypogaea]